MDQEILVREMIEEGKRLLERLVAEGVPVTAACWVKESENERWYLYIATPLVPEDGVTRQAYMRINTVLRQLEGSFEFDPFRIRAFAASSPVAEAILALYKHHPRRGPIRYRDYRLGDVSVEDAYIYPPMPAPVP
jgi:hypothetical protein